LHLKRRKELKKRRTEETESGHKTMAAPKTEETIVETSIKKGQQLIKRFQEVAGIRDYENR